MTLPGPDSGLRIGCFVSSTSYPLTLAGPNSGLHIGCFVSSTSFPLTLPGPDSGLRIGCFVSSTSYPLTLPGPDSGLRIGCYADDSHDRDLPYEPFTDPKVGMWPPMCIDHCFRNGYYYAGVQVTTCTGI
mgnify:CR=1 FL=1